MTTFGALPINAIFVRINPDHGAVLRVKTGTATSRVIEMIIPGTKELVPTRNTDQEKLNQPVQLIQSSEELKIAS
jgi:hypothetical protein